MPELPKKPEFHELPHKKFDVPKPADKPVAKPAEKPLAAPVAPDVVKPSPVVKEDVHKTKEGLQEKMDKQHELIAAAEARVPALKAELDTMIGHFNRLK
jgi:hypothetical protein